METAEVQCPAGRTCCKKGESLELCPLATGICCGDSGFCCPQNQICSKSGDGSQPHCLMPLVKQNKAPVRRASPLRPGKGKGNLNVILQNHNKIITTHRTVKTK